MEQLFAILTFFLSTQGVLSTSVYEPLVKYIKSQSNPKLIPRPSADHPLVVDFQASWLDIQDVSYENNEMEGIFSTTVGWASGITWNPDDFSGKTSVALSSYDVYRPVITIINVLGKLETWHGDSVQFHCFGSAVIRTHFRGRIFCNEELHESNKCRIRVASYSMPSDVISFLEPSQRHFDLREIYEKFSFKGSRYNLTSHRYEIHKERAEQVGMIFEYMDYIFSIEEKESKSHQTSVEVKFEFN